MSQSRLWALKLPDGRKLKTLADCAYILALPEREQAEARWQGAAGELLKAAELGSLFLFTARLAFSRALLGIEGVEPSPAPHATNQDKWKAKRKQRPCGFTSTRQSRSATRITYSSLPVRIPPMLGSKNLTLRAWRLSIR